MIRFIVRMSCVLGLLVMPAIASAQADAAAPAWFVGGLGGLTFGTVTSGAVGGQVGFKIAPNLFVIGEVGRMRNVMPKEISDDLDDFVDLLELELGVPISFDVSLPATYGFGGVRWMAPGRRVSPFVEAGVGAGHISLSVDKAAVLGIDVSDEIDDELGEDANATKFLIALGGGVSASLSRTVWLDLGFRYTRIATEDPSINSSMVYAAVKIGR
jgi:hypothetical protein